MTQMPIRPILVSTDDIPSRDDPYDPDMTVQEALEAGLIAIIDSGRTGSTYGQMCDYAPGYRGLDQYGISCTRVKGHQGKHAYVLRWDMSVQDQLDEERRVRADMDRMKNASVTVSDKMAKELQGLSEQMAALKDAAKLAEQMKEIAKAVNLPKDEQRMVSAVYNNPERGTRKKDKFRDSNVGKVRGRR